MKRMIVVGLACAALSACATANPQITAGQVFETSWAGLDVAAKATVGAINTGALVPGSANAKRAATDLQTAASVLTAADNARLTVGNGQSVTADVTAAAAALADVATILGSK